MKELCELRIFAAAGRRHRSLPGHRQRFGADPARCRGRNLARLRRTASTRTCAQIRTRGRLGGATGQLTRYNDRMALVLEDPGGVPLDRLLGRPLDVSHFLRLAIPLAGALRQVHERGLIHKDIKPANILVDTRKRRGVADRVRHRLAPAARAPGARAAGGDRRDPRLHGARADRPDEPLDRFPQRSLRARRHLLRDADRDSCPSPRPTRWSGCTATSRRQPVPPGERAEGCPGAVSAIVMKLLAKTAEERYQTAAGLESDLRRCLAEWETQRPHRRLPARRTRHARPAADSRETVRASARDRDLARRLRPRRQERHAGAGAGLRLFRHRQVLGRQ